jgi:hypothetical protein
MLPLAAPTAPGHVSPCMQAPLHCTAAGSITTTYSLSYSLGCQQNIMSDTSCINITSLVGSMANDILLWNDDDDDVRQIMVTAFHKFGTINANVVIAVDSRVADVCILCIWLSFSFLF